MVLKQFNVANPAAGHDWDWVVPGQYEATLIAVHAELVATTNPTTSPDLSPNAGTFAYNAAMYSRDTFGVAGPFGGAPNLGVATAYGSVGGGYLGQFTNSAGLVDVGTFTLEVLAYEGSVGGNISQTVLSVDDAQAPTNFRYGMQLDRPSAGVRAVASRTDTFSLGVGLGGDAWGQAALTYDGAQWIGYANGAAGAPIAGHAPTLAVVNKPAWVAGDGVSSQGLGGRIAAAAIYSGALSAARIAAHNTARGVSAAAYAAAMLADNPLVFWMFDQTQQHFQRSTTLALSDGSSSLAVYPGFAPTQQANLFSWTWQAAGQAAVQSPDQSVTVVPIAPVTLPPGYHVSTVTLDLNAADQWQNVVVWADVADSGLGGNGAGGDSGTVLLKGILTPDYRGGR